MKRKLLLAFLGIAVCNAVLYAQTLDEAILTAAITISGKLPVGSSVAVINFNSDSKNLNEYVLNELHGAILRNRGVIPVQPNLSQFQTIWGEINTTGELNSESVRSIGKLLGVQYLITGSINQNGTLYNIVFNTVNLDAELKSQYQASLNPRGDTQLALLLGIKSQMSAGSISASQPGPVTIAAIAGVTVPVAGKTPVKKITGNSQYTGTVTWSPAVSKTFEPNTQYTATITLTAKTGYTLQGIETNFFTVAGTESTSNNANSYIVTAQFPSTKDYEDAYFKTLGVSLAMAPYYQPQLNTEIYGTFSPFKNSFLKLGVDAGWDINHSIYGGYFVEDFYLYPFANYALFLPFSRTKRGKRIGGWYAGAGLGVHFVNYIFEDVGSTWDTFATMNIFTGFNLGMFDISYTLRTNFDSFHYSMVFIGYVYRFK